MYAPVFADLPAHSDLSFHSPWFWEPLALVTAPREVFLTLLLGMKIH